VLTNEHAAGLFLAVSFIYTVDTAIRATGLGWTAFSAAGWNLFDTVVSVGSLTTTGISQAKDSVGDVMQQLQKLFVVTIAFKLIQRVDSLNKLFKTVRYVPAAFDCFAMGLSVCGQGESVDADQPLGPVVHLLPVLRDHAPRGLRPDKVGHGGDALGELLLARLVDRHARLHDHGRGLEPVHA
jgi:hypothetical protein